MTFPKKTDQSNWLKDVLTVVLFIITVVVVSVLINAFLFRSYSVNGPSMQPTLYTNDRLIVNRLPITWAKLHHKNWLPQRDQVVVFKNPIYIAGQPDKYLVKRVIGLPGERVLVKNNKITIFNQTHPTGFNPDIGVNGPTKPVSGQIDIVVPKDHIFVSGDHRNGNFSFDSRNGLGTVPIENLQGPVELRFYPFDKIRTF